MTPSTAGSSSGKVTVVVITRNRLESLLHTLERLRGLPAVPPVVVVDNASTDGTALAVRGTHPDVDVVRLDRNVGAAGRTVGVLRASTPYVAFSDDDSWWDAGALDEAASLLDRNPRLAVVAGRILVGPEGRLDPVCREMAHSPLGELPGAGPVVLGFVACGAVVRRSAYLEVGGFHPRYGVGGEEALLAIDLAERGWLCAYVDRVVASHHPSPQRGVGDRQVGTTRNDLWTLWLRHPPPAAVIGTLQRLRRWRTEPGVLAGLRQAVAGWRWVLGERAVVTPATARALRLLSPAGDRPVAQSSRSASL
jgi:GT2 family glycosyltransferase